MKKLLLSLLTLCTCTAVFCQTDNHFPTTGNAGIGTGASPSDPLTIRMNGSYATMRLIRYGSNPADFSLRSGFDQLEFVNGSSIRMVLESNGNVGIGTTNPGNSALRVHSDGSRVAHLKLTNASNSKGGVQFGYTSPTSNDVEIWQKENNFFRIGTNGTERLRVTANGSIGIGTTSPGADLHLEKNESTVQFVASGGGYTKDLLTLKQSGRGDTDVYNLLKIENSAGTKMLVAGNGNVGVGTTAPEDKLQVASDNYNDIFSIRRKSSGNKNTFDFRISSNPNGTSALSSRSLTILPTEYAADIALLSDPAETRPQFVLKSDGKVGIGTTSPSEQLEVDGNALIDGNVYSKKVNVSTNPGNWPDYVFASDYKLPSLAETEAFIKANKHLPEVPSAKEVEEEGQDLGEIQATLLKKMEEMTLHMIELNKRVEQLEKENKALKEKDLKD